MGSPSKKDVAFFARTNFRGEKRKFGITQADRRAHMYIVGKTGVGKSTLIETLIRQDFQAGRGCILIDPHGDLADRLAGLVPLSRVEDFIYLDAADQRQTIGFNPLAHVPQKLRSVAASGLLEAFKKIWQESWGPRLEHILRNALFALLEQPSATLSDIVRLLEDAEYRTMAAHRVANTQVRRFWLNEYENYPTRLRAEAIAPIQNKVGAFLADPLLNRIITQNQHQFDLRQMLDQRKILLVNLSKGRIGENAAALLGALLVSTIGTMALSRANEPEEERQDFMLYMDEFNSYSTPSVASMFSELRKYRVGLVLANQYLSQLEPPLRDAVMGNTGTIISFRVSLSDAEILAKEFYPHFTIQDFVNLPNHNFYIKMMIDGEMGKPFSAETIKPNKVR